MAIIVGLNGRKGAGKDTAAQPLIEKYGFERVSLADPIREMARKLNPVISVVMDQGRPKQLRVTDFIDAGWSEEKIKRQFVVYRDFLKTLGTDCVREYDADFWVKIALAKMNNPHGRYVVTDVRFPNEAAGILSQRDHSVHLWYIQNDIAEAVPVDHDSEKWAGQLGHTRTLHNNGTIPELHADIDILACDMDWDRLTLAAA